MISFYGKAFVFGNCWNLIPFLKVVSTASQKGRSWGKEVYSIVPLSYFFEKS